MNNHSDCYVNCGWTDCMATVTYSEPCKHKNGWYVVVKFWIFSKRIFVCSDCGEHTGGG